jgi:hypothetical protein
MGFRFRRSIRLGKGLRINLSKSGTSLSVGHRGATVNFGPKGEKVTVGLPGTGLSYSKMIGRPAESERSSHNSADENEPPPLPLDQTSRKAIILPWLAVLAIVLVIIAALIAQSN